MWLPWISLSRGQQRTITTTLTHSPSLNAPLHEARATRKMTKPLILHVNAIPHMSRDTSGVNAGLGWIVLLHPPLSPDLSSFFYLFGPLMDHMWQHSTWMKRYCRSNVPVAAEEVERLLPGIMFQDWKLSPPSQIQAYHVVSGSFKKYKVWEWNGLCHHIHSEFCKNHLNGSWKQAKTSLHEWCLLNVLCFHNSLSLKYLLYDTQSTSCTTSVHWPCTMK